MVDQRVGSWTVGQPLTRNKPGVVRVIGADGTAGVAKLAPQGRNGRTATGRAAKRFEAEARLMPTLSTVPGCMPVLDVDPAAPPGWFVMPEAVDIAAHLGPQPTLRDVVHVVRDVADTLASLSERPERVAHRDVKPANLLWLDDRVVVADFGIAAWVGAAGMTRLGDGVGPAHFVAPEMRSTTQKEDPFRADVYSLAKALHVLAYPGRGPYPPPGRHSTDDFRTFSLEPAGGDDAAELDVLMERCTDNQPYARPFMRDVATELTVWLGRHPTPFRREPRTFFGQLGLSGIAGEHAAQVKLDRQVFWELRRAVNRFGRLDPNASVSADVTPDRVQAPDGTWERAGLDDHGDPSEPDGSLVLAVTLPGADHRLLLGAYTHAGDATWFAEWQTRVRPADTPDVGAAGAEPARTAGIWTLDWAAHEDAPVGFPSAAKATETLVDAGLANRPGHAGPSPADAPTLSRIR